MYPSDVIDQKLAFSAYRGRFKILNIHLSINRYDFYFSKDFS